MTKSLNRKCEFCGMIYTKRGRHKECSLQCRIKNRIKEINGCWEWQQIICKITGYGRIRIEGKLMTTHRASYSIFKGTIPTGFLVLHRCDNRKCCNPDHLWLGTHKENTGDMIKKGRMSSFKGEGNSNAILTEEKVLQIRDLHKKGNSIKNICDKFGIKYFTCLDVINKRNWNHI